MCLSLKNMAATKHFSMRNHICILKHRDCCTVSINFLKSHFPNYNKINTIEKLENIKMSNILALGILSKVSGLFSLEILEKALNNVIPAHRKNLIPKNIEALKLGYEYDLFNL